MTAVKATEFEGDWYLIPNREYDKFVSLTNQWYDLEYDYDSLSCAKSNIDIELEKFEVYKTGGDLNLTQLYIKN